jgi:epoxyqueuosine reductase
MENIISLNLKDKIINYCKSLGLDTIGFTKCRVFEESREFFEERSTKGLQNEFEEKNINRRVDPSILHSGGKTIISIAFPYLFDRENSNGAYFSLYTRGRDYHYTASEYLKKICSFIEGLGGRTQYFVDSNALPERYIALLAGVGFIGKNNMLITKKYGSYVFLSEIIMDLELESDSPLENGCGECSLCMKACPAGALGTNRSCSDCLSYITQKKHISDEEILKFKGRLFGCDTCQLVCPYNKTAESSKLEEFMPFNYMSNVDLKEIAVMSSSIFKEKYGLTSCGWRGRNVLQRNALINLTHVYGPESLREIKIYNINSPYVKDYYHRLLNIFQL